MQSELFETTFSLVSCALVLLDDQGRVLKANEAFADLLGYAPAQLLGEPFLDLLHCADREHLQALHGQTLADCLAGLPLELRYCHKDGSLLNARSKWAAAGTQLLGEIVPLEAAESPEKHLRQEHWLQRIAETVPGIIGGFRLNSDAGVSTPWASPGIKERLILMDLALSHMHEAVYLIDQQARFCYVNDEACRSLGYSREELLRMTVADMDPDWTNEQIVADWQNTPERSPDVIESRHRTKDGRIFPVEISITYLELSGKSYSLELARDITERNRTQATLRENERRYREVFDHSADCLYLVEITEDQQFRYIEVNAAFERTSGLDRKQLIGRLLGEAAPAAGRKVIMALEHCLARGETFEWESELELPTGIIATHSIFIPVRDEQGRLYRIAGISRDITERKRMENRLLASEQQFRALAENSLNLIIRYDLNCQRTYVNPAFERETGIPANQALQLSLEDSWVGDITIAEHQALLRQVVATRKPMESVQEWRCPTSGEQVVHSIQLIPERGMDGTVVSVLAQGHNITALKRHERLEEARLRIFEQLSQGSPLPEVLALVAKYIEQARPDFLASIMLVDDDRYLISGSAPSLPPDYLAAIGRIEIGEGAGICGTAAWRRITVIAEDLSTHPYCEAQREHMLKAGLRACWSEPIMDSVGKVLGTFCIYLRQPREPMADDLKLVHQASHLAAIAIERKRAETSLLESEQRYRQIFDNSLDALFLLEVIGNGCFRTLEVNPALERSVGMGRAELIGKAIEETLPPQIAAAAIIRFQRCVDSESPIDEEMELDLPIGHLTFHSTLIPVRGVYGRTQRIIGIFRDITERKHAERVLHVREQEFRALVENAPDVIARFDPQCRFLYANPAAQAMLYRPLDKLLGKRTSETSPHSCAARVFQDKLEEIVRTGDVTEAETILNTPASPSAEAACYQVRLVPERDREGQLVSILAVGRNISAMRAAERRLKESHAQLHQLSNYRETAREEERKHIAREIHDELGQQLTALRMGISLLRLQFGKDHPLLVERVQALMTRVDETIQVVRNVATRLRPSALDMGLTSALEWLVSEFSRHSGIPCQLQAPSAKLKLDDERATAAFRVIQESLTNVARHAQASRVDIHLESCADHVLIEVHDNGKGFDPEQPLKGTLGIVGMRERGHMLGAEVIIHSAPGRGTRVQVRIPIQTGAEKS